MPSFKDMMQKALYLGVGLASLATEKASSTIAELRNQAQKLADEMVDRGEMTTEEARKFVEEIIKKAQQQQAIQTNESEKQPEDKKEPRLIEIVTDEDNTSEANAPRQQSATEVKDNNSENLDALREQVQSLQEELRRLKKD